MERPTRRVARVRPHTQFTCLPDGTWQADFAPMGTSATGPTEEDAYKALYDAIKALLAEGDEAVVERWQAWAADHHEVEPIDDDEWAKMQQTMAAGAAASEGMPALTDESFDAFVAGPGPALVDFWAEWCMPCHMLAPVLRQVADRLGDRVRVGKLNVEEHETVWDKVDSQSLPTIVLYRDGSPVHTIIGFGHTPDELIAELEPHLA